VEDSNEIRGSEVENRLYNLERIVRRFKIAVAGDGNVIGGFGKLDHHDDPNVRLSNLEQAVGKFEVRGNNVEVGGSFDDGFNIS
jgi:hypothetical protein